MNNNYDITGDLFPTLKGAAESSVKKIIACLSKASNRNNYALVDCYTDTLKKWVEILKGSN